MQVPAGADVDPSRLTHLDFWLDPPAAVLVEVPAVFASVPDYGKSVLPLMVRGQGRIKGKNSKPTAKAKPKPKPKPKAKQKAKSKPKPKPEPEPTSIVLQF